MSGRTWTRDKDAEGFPEWASRVYRSADGWTLERYYVEGDRGLVRPEVAWNVYREDLSGYGSGGYAPTMAEAKRWPESTDGRAYIERGAEARRRLEAKKLEAERLEAERTGRPGPVNLGQSRNVSQ